MGLVYTCVEQQGPYGSPTWWPSSLAPDPAGLHPSRSLSRQACQPTWMAKGNSGNTFHQSGHTTTRRVNSISAADEKGSVTLIALDSALLVRPRSLTHWGLTHWAKFQKGPSVPISPMRSAPRYMPGPLRASSAPCRCSGTSGWWPEPSRTTCRGGRGGHGQGTK